MLLSDSAMPWLDVEAFGAACRRARETRDPGDYRSAAELYRGDLLPEDQFEVWAEAPREALRERHLGLMVEYAEVLSERREYSEVVDIVGAVTAADPFHEGAYRTLMTALAAPRAALRGPRGVRPAPGERSPGSTRPTPSRPPGGSTATC